MSHTEHVEKSPSTRTGRFAALARALGFDGSGARSVGLIAVFAIALSALVPNVAAAALTRAPESFSPITGSGSGITIGSPGGIAVDETSGNAFLNDGTALADLLGGEGAAPAGLVSPFQITGLTFPVGTNGIAVDNSAASPNQGTVYIVSGNKVKKFTLNTVAEKYELAGELTPVPPAGKIFGTSGNAGAAVDAQGDLYVGEFTCGCVVKFDPTGTEVAKYNFANPSPVVRPTSLAVSGSGNLFIGRGLTGSVFEFVAPGSGEIVNPPVTQVIAAGATGLAIDPATEKLYIALGTRVAQYDATTLTEEFSFGEEVLGTTTRLAVDSATNRIYVADSADSRIKVFGPAIVVPGAKAEAASSVKAFAGTLHGTVEPAGIAVTGCVFEYGTSPQALGNSTPCEGSIPTDEDSHPVTAAVTGLDADTTYFYRLAATNANGTGHSGIESFITPQPAVTEAASDVTPRRATLHGTVLPEGEEVTGCHFEYGEDTTYGSSVPCEGSTPTDEGSHPVTAKIAGLKPAGVVYHFRLVVERGPIVVHGADETLETPGTVTTGAVAFTGTNKAVLAGTVDPAGEQLQQCEFEYGETELYGETAPCSQSPASIGSGEAPVPVSAAVEGLILEGEYHYRLTVIDGEGTAIHGGDRTFLTSPPKIEFERNIAVGADNATLEAGFQTFGNEIEAYLEYGTTTAYDQATAPVKLSGGPEQVVAEQISGLATGTAYHWRVVVLNPLGGESGPDRTFTTSTPRPLETNCQNQEFRTGTPGANLPDCRAYEKVTPNEKNGTDGVREGYPTDGTADGDGLSFMSFGNFAGSPSSSLPNAYLAHRGSDGWQVSPASAPNPAPTAAGANGASYEFSSDLSRRVATVIKQSLAEGASPETTNLFAVDAAGTYSWVNNMPPAVKLPEECPRPSLESACYQLVDLVAFAGASEDFRHVLFEYKGSFSDPESFETLYRSDLEGGSWHVSPVDSLPDGQPAPEGSTAGSGSRFNYSSSGPSANNRVINAISANGANVIFQAKSDEGEPNEAGQAGMTEVYDSVGRGSTVEISAPSPGATPAHPGAGPATFLAASTDGGRVFFTSPAELTTPSNTGPAQEGNDLYEYSFAGGGTLKDLTVDASGAGARVLGVLNASDDGSTIYFVARGELSPGEGEAGAPNLYMIRNGGAPVFIATLSDADFEDWEVEGNFFEPARPGGATLESYVTPNGDSVAFTSRLQLSTANFPAGYGNVNPQTGTVEPEVYEYSAASGELLCVSCDPTGAAPIGAGTLAGVVRRGGGQSGAGTTQNSAFHLVRPVSADGGRVFFSSEDPLVPGIPATSTRAKVFEFERRGEGSCASPGGCVNLISSPTAEREAVFLEADESGQNVFFASGERLTSADQDNALDIYDARVEGGFPEPPPQAPCEAEGCRGPGSSAAPATTNSPTSSFKGPGNGTGKAAPKKCRKNQVKKHGRCVKRSRHHGKRHKAKKAHKGHKGKGGHHQDRRAAADRRAGR